MEGIGFGEEGFIGPKMIEEKDLITKRSEGIGFGEEGYVGPAGVLEQNQRRYERVVDALDKMEGINKEEQLDHILAADFLSQRFNVPPEHVRRNLDLYSEKYFRDGKPDKTPWLSIKDKYKEGQLAVDISKLGIEMLKRPTDISLYEEYAELLDSYPSPDNKKDRGFLTKAAQSSANFLPSIGSVLFEGLQDGAIGASIGGLAGAALAGPAGLGAGAKLGYNLGTRSGSFKASSELSAGAIFSDIMTLEVPGYDGKKVYQLLNEKDKDGNALVDTDQIVKVARMAAITGGAVSGAIEAISPSIERFPGLSSQVFENAGRKALKELITKGVFAKKGGQLLVNYGLNIAEETLQEISQEITEMAAKEVTKKVLKETENLNIPYATKKEWGETISETFKETAKGMSLLGISGAAASTFRKTGAPGDKKSQKKTLSPEIFRDKEGIKEVPLSQIALGATTKKGITRASEQYDKAREGKGYIAPIKVVEEEGELKTASSEDAAMLHTFLENNEEGIKVEIVDKSNLKANSSSRESVPDWKLSKKDFEEKNRELVSEIQREENIIPFRNKEEWKLNKNQFAQKKSSFIEDDIHFKTVETIKDLEYNLQSWGKISEEDSGILGGMFEAVAAAKGMDLPSYINKYYADGVFSTEPVKTNKSYAAAVSILDDGKRLIHLTKDSDFTSIVHEASHVIRGHMEGGDLEKLTDYYKQYEEKFDKEWTVSMEEKFTSDFMHYLEKGEAPDTQLQKLFNQIAKGIKKVYDLIARREVGGAEVPAEIKEVFDRIFTREGEVKADLTSASDYQAEMEEFAAFLDRDKDQERFKELEAEGSFDDDLLFQENVLFQEHEQNDLIVQHNLSLRNLKHAQKMGGLAAPSLAITTPATSTTNFGEISLLSSPSLIDPKKSNSEVYAEDVYSPRYPSVIYEINYNKLKDFDEEAKILYLDQSSIEERGLEGLYKSAPVRLKYLKEIGKIKSLPKRKKKYPAKYYKTMPTVRTQKGLNALLDLHLSNLELEIAADEKIQARRKGKGRSLVLEKRFKEAREQRKADLDFVKNLDRKKDNKQILSDKDILRDLERIENEIRSYKPIDDLELDSRIRNILQSEKVLDQFERWVDKNYSDVIKNEKIFKGFTYGGNRRYTAHTLDNVVSILTKNIRGGESFHYGVNSIKSHLIKRYKSLEEIKNSRDNLVSKEKYEESQEALSQEFDEVSKMLNNEYVSERLEEAAQRGLRSLDNYYSSYDAAMITQFFNHLKSAPAKYFEAKVKRAVKLNEFETALVPREKRYDEAAHYLRGEGLKIRRYSDKEERSKILGQQNKLLFQEQDKNLLNNLEKAFKPLESSLVRNTEGDYTLKHDEGNIPISKRSESADQLERDLNISREICSEQGLASGGDKVSQRWDFRGYSRQSLIREFSNRGRFDLRGKVFKELEDVATILSIYRNPFIEYFHIIYVDENDQILAHNTMSSGLPSRTFAVDSKSMAISAYKASKRMERLGAAGYYLAHNHPSGEITESRQDLGLTQGYIDNIPGFKGHAILDHTQFRFIHPDGKNSSVINYDPQIKYDSLQDYRTMNGPQKFFSYLGPLLNDANKDVLIYLNTQLKVIGHEPIKFKLTSKKAFELMRANQATFVVYGTTDEKNYQALNSEYNEKFRKEYSPTSEVIKNDVFLDIVHIDLDTGRHSNTNKDGFTPLWADVSSRLNKRGYLFQENSIFETKEDKEKAENLLQTAGVQFSLDTTNISLDKRIKTQEDLFKGNLFQNDYFLSEHEQIIKKAVEEYKPVPQDVLEEYKDTPWGAKEIRRREILKDYEWLIDYAHDTESPEEFKSFFEMTAFENEEKAFSDLSEDDSDRFFKEIWMRANTVTREEANKKFIDNYANEKGAYSLATEVKSNWKEYKGSGIPGPIWVLGNALNGSKDKERLIKGAITSIKNNPTEIRRAIAAVSGDQWDLMRLDWEEEIEQATPEEVKIGRLSQEERLKQAAKTTDKEIKKMLLTGVGTDKESLLAYDQEINKRITVLKSEHTKLVKKLQETIKKQDKKLDNQIKANLRTKKLAKDRDREAIKEAEIAVRKRIKASMDRKREIKNIKDRMRVLNKNILRPPSDNIHYTYKVKIRDLQKDMAKGFRRDAKAERLKKRREYFESHPELIEKLTEEQKQEIFSKPLNDFTLIELEKINGMVEKLRHKGIVEKSLIDEDKKAKRLQLASDFILEIGNGDIPSIPSIPTNTKEWEIWQKSSKLDQVLLNTLRPSRILKDLGGEGSHLVKFFWEKMNEKTDESLKHKLRRIEAGKAKMKELGITPEVLNKKLYAPGTDENPQTVNDAIQLYIAGNNEKNRRAFKFGVGIENIKIFTDQLTKNQIKFADYIKEDFDSNFDRYATAYAEDKNEVLGRQDGYFPMKRQTILNEQRNDEILRDMGSSAGVMDAYANRASTHKRINIANEHQDPIRMGAVELWFEEIERQEHYIASAAYIKDMHAILRMPSFQAALVQSHGSETVKWFEKYINEFANPNIYKFYDTMSLVSKTLRNNMALAYLSFNTLTIAKQAPSLALFMGRVGPQRLLASASKFMVNPLKYLNFVNERDPQMQERSMNRIMEELKLEQVHPTQKVISKIGQIGMKPISMVDKMATTIGWMAVYDANISKGEAVASKMAQEAVLETQPAARAKDLAAIYKSNEGFNWFLMFTNQINQTWNILTSDIPRKARQAQVLKALGMVTGLGISFATIALLSGWKPWEADEPEEWAKEVGVQLTKSLFNTVPIIGSTVVSGLDGWMNSGVQPVPVAAEIGKTLKEIIEGDGEGVVKKLPKLAETAGAFAGVPIMPIKRSSKAVKKASDEEYTKAALEFMGYRTE